MLPPVTDDEELHRVFDWFQAQPDMASRFGRAIRTALDEVIDTPRTGRWDIEACNDQEKSYVGVKIEHVIRGDFDLSYGAEGMDYRIDNVDVDCKWSKNWGAWQIPLEADLHICLLVYADDGKSEFGVGLIRIYEKILVGGNRDKKRTIQSPGGRSRIRWLVELGPGLPKNFVLHMDPEDRLAVFSHSGGDARARELFIRCEGEVIRRHTIESIGRQVDEGRRFRGETRERLRNEGFEVLNGHWKDQRARAVELGGPVLRADEWICLRSDGSTFDRLAARKRTLW